MEDQLFRLQAPFKPSGDQPKAIDQLVAGLKAQREHQTLLGVTGSGKTFTIANVIQAVQKPTLVIAPNKTLAAQLTQEFRTFFPDNAVEYFVSYYDYYQPEAYLPGTDTYIEKETDINDEVERLRHAATAALFSRKDVIIVGTVSVIYGLGSPEEYQAQHVTLAVGKPISRATLISQLVRMHYLRTTTPLKRGSFRTQGPIFEIMPPDREIIIRVELLGDHIERINQYESVTHEPLPTPKQVHLYPAKHFVTSKEVLKRSITAIEAELGERLKELEGEGKLLEIERLERRTRHDIALLREIGTCPGIENYSRYLTGREPGQPPYTLIDFFLAPHSPPKAGDVGSKDYLLVIDESHVTIPQIAGMYAGDRSRKETLVEYGFRLPSALDNRPLTFQEFEARVHQAIYISATPGKYELQQSKESSKTINNQPSTINSFGIAEQIVRPTGLIDPEIILRSASQQVTDLITQVQAVVAEHGRVLVTTLTKRQSEQLHEHLKEQGIKAGYLHSEVKTLDRLRTLEELRGGVIDCLVGVNLLREGLDLPEVSLVAILDADQEGFLRSETSLIQTMGRAARNIRGRVILYADRVTGSMQRAISEAQRRRELQFQYNQAHGISPKSIEKAITTIIDHELTPPPTTKEYTRLIDPAELPAMIRSKETEMRTLAKDLKFEAAALIRDEVIELKRLMKSR